MAKNYLDYCECEGCSQKRFLAARDRNAIGWKTITFAVLVAGYFIWQFCR